jgi:hypothetical protein
VSKNPRLLLDAMEQYEKNDKELMGWVDNLGF